MESHDAQSEREGVGLPKVYAIVTSSESRNDVHPITVQEFVHDQIEYSRY